MINLYNNHQNSNLKFKMDITGVQSTDIMPRLVIESGDSVYMVKGKINGKECEFDIPVLEGFQQGLNGRVYYEVIIQEEQYQKVWQEDFEVVSKTEIKVLESNFSQEEEKVEKPKVNLTSVVQVEQVNEEIEEADEEIEESIEDEVSEESEVIDEVGSNESEVEEVKENKKTKKKDKKTKAEIYTESLEEDKEDKEDVLSFDKFSKR